MSKTLRVSALEVGRNYRIIFKNQGDRLPREMVASYMGPGDSSTSLFFSGRPAFGTTAVRIDTILEIWTTDKQKMPPTIYRGETRVF